jgi:hypothetical protein
MYPGKLEILGIICSWRGKFGKIKKKIFDHTYLLC